ncbi:ornithine cyclodeaminase family protein [Kitasatospora sp. RB6PN24]|uniref:ornithine cyclodeaminase family protein n=1 Tax=Kitasatospora humi TaxID=2893891 RepID=UPI001E49D831|nr:ornithine cyclodeaminase family protein [Kitasatospora humi]MCC9307507.1 ornithine cyclodeaminase family protein [Kitasatospora humi]
MVPVRLSPADAVAALTEVLQGGLDPESCPARLGVPVPSGELLLMPAATAEYAGVKIAGVAPRNPERGLPRITGSYLLLDGATLLPLALLDGAALTALRTPAVTALALDRLAAPTASHLVLFGTGPQAYGHLDALRGVRPLERVTVVGRRSGPVAELVAHAERLGLAAASGTPDAVADADLVVCCTTATEPLFDGGRVPDHAAVAAVGSHSPTGREVDSALVRRSACYVEARAVALREAGDLLLALSPEGAAPLAAGEQPARGQAAGEPAAREQAAWEQAAREEAAWGEAAREWTNLAELVTGAGAGAVGAAGAGGSGVVSVPLDRPRFFKSVGMAWQDLAVAVAAYRAWGGRWQAAGA